MSRSGWMLLALVACGDKDETGEVPGVDDTATPAGDTGQGTDDTGCTPSTWYADGDGDGFGDADAPVEACEPPSGAVADATDCDDGDPAVNPDADEVCSGVDDDCDGLVDDADDSLDASSTTTWYDDLDGDGYGDSSAASASCAQPSSTVSVDGDCDDGDGAIHPGARDTCADGVDQDCDGSDAACASFSVADAAMKIEGEQEEEWLGAEVALLGDTDGDGAVDFVLAAPGHDRSPHPNSQDKGAAYLFDGLTTGTVIASAADSYLFGASGTYIPLGGITLVGPGDVDGDGYDDLLAGTPYESIDDVWGGVIEVSFAPFSASQALFGASVHPSSFQIYGPSSYDYFGDTAAYLGDLDGDGKDDVFAARSSKSTAHVYYGGARGGEELEYGYDDIELTGSDWDAVYGSALAGGGDVDGDGMIDVLIGGPGDGTDASFAGSTYLKLGPSSSYLPLVNYADAEITGEAGGDALGTSLDIRGDVDGDGYDDVLLGASGNDEHAAGAGAAYLFLGPLSGELSADEGAVLLYGADAGGAFGHRVSLQGDLDGDGARDLVIAAPRADGGETGSGVVYVYTGVTSGTLEVGDAAMRVHGQQAGERVGTSLAVLGDLDGDGLDDLLLGAEGYDTKSYGDAGAAYVILGGDLGL